MDEKTILADLKGRFGAKIFLTIQDLAELYCTTPMALYHKRSRGNWPFGPFANTEGSGQILVSIYKVAEVLALELERKAGKAALAKSSPKKADLPRRRLTFKQAAKAVALARAEAVELACQAEAMQQLVVAMEAYLAKQG